MWIHRCCRDITAPLRQGRSGQHPWDGAGIQCRGMAAPGGKLPRIDGIQPFSKQLLPRGSAHGARVRKGLTVLEKGCFERSMAGDLDVFDTKGGRIQTAERGRCEMTHAHGGDFERQLGEMAVSEYAKNTQMGVEEKRGFLREIHLLQVAI